MHRNYDNTREMIELGTSQPGPVSIIVTLIILLLEFDLQQLHFITMFTNSVTLFPLSNTGCGFFLFDIYLNVMLGKLS